MSDGPISFQKSEGNNAPVSPTNPLPVVGISAGAEDVGDVYRRATYFYDGAEGDATARLMRMTVETLDGPDGATVQTEVTDYAYEYEA